ncbi:MAG: hypothetical protein N7Q72_04945 [Spiroplasma sp. Tabriz.8]|nr:hypothetical protein [Spiroplasma sp. Tabriz.8]
MHRDIYIYIYIYIYRVQRKSVSAAHNRLFNYLKSTCYYLWLVCIN